MAVKFLLSNKQPVWHITNIKITAGSYIDDTVNIELADRMIANQMNRISWFAQNISYIKN